MAGYFVIFDSTNMPFLMTIDALQAICEKLPGVTKDIKWENHLCFNVGGKMFLVTNPDSVPHTATFKVQNEEFEEISHRKGFKPAAYLSRYNWVHVEGFNNLTKKEWEYYIRQSYQLVFDKLPAKVRKGISV
jgi:predicted DNA-binding protein (MmcQ/YjbR family)